METLFDLQSASNKKMYINHENFIQITFQNSTLYTTLQKSKKSGNLKSLWFNNLMSRYSVPILYIINFNCHSCFA